MKEIDLPAELVTRMPRAWTTWDLYVFKTDLKTMACRSSVWNRAFNPSGPTYREGKDWEATEKSWVPK